MPEPFAMAPKRTSLPPILAETAHAFEYVSVVMIALPAFTLPSAESSPIAALMPVSILSIGSVTPITPVEPTMTSFSLHPRASAARRCILWASLSPCSPVQALAQPALATIACALPFATTSFDAKTGAAATRFCVKVPATAASFSV